LLILMLLACTGKDANTSDSGDTGPSEDDFPCDAEYFPVDFNTRRYAYTEYQGRFQQPNGVSGTRYYSFQGLLEDGDTGESDEEPLEACVFSLIVPFAEGDTFSVYSLDDEFINLVADGGRDDANNPEYYYFDPAIPLIPRAPVDGWEETFVVDYDFLAEEESEITVQAAVASVDATVSVPAGDYDEALLMTWTWLILDGAGRISKNVDITAYFDKEAGLVRQAWYDQVEDYSAEVVFEGY
jgi:hypothetical protein